MSFENPPAEEIRALLERVRTIAVVGASPKPARPSHLVMRYLLDAGYRCIPVRPGQGEVLGIPTVPSLSEVGEPIDLVDVFRAPQYVAGIVEEAIAIGATALWLQDGVIDEEAALRAREAGLAVVMDTCTLREHSRLIAK